MNDYIRNTITRIEAGELIEMETSLKNEVNAVLANKIQIGDPVQIIRTGKVGKVTKKIKYQRDPKDWFSPYGYTAIQVNINGRKQSYSARSLRRLTTMTEAVENDAYMGWCRCPECGEYIKRTKEEKVIRCECGKELYIRAYTQEELDRAFALEDLEEE